ncbi:unnamed protein product [Ophioblennius macclurei]
MEQNGSQLSKTLLTPYPHYIPGYTGYCPQFKYNFAKPYGKMTNKLLTSPDVNHSDNLVLANNRLPLRPHITDCNLRTVIPGFTGFIPKTRDYFGCSYEAYRKACCDSYDEQQETSRRRSSSLPSARGYCCQQIERPKLPLTSICDDVFPYDPTKCFTPFANPYAMVDDNPHKYFIPGFTGHVPQARFLFGKGFPGTTKEALIQFHKEYTCFPEPNARIRTTSNRPPVPPAPSFPNLQRLDRKPPCPMETHNQPQYANYKSFKPRGSHGPWQHEPHLTCYREVYTYHGTPDG